MQVIKPPLGIKAPLLGLGTPLSPSRLLGQEKSILPAIPNSLVRSLFLTQGLGLSQFPPLFSPSEVLPTSIDRSLIGWNAELPQIEVKPLEIKNEQQDDRNSDIASQFCNRQFTPKQAKSKANNKQSKAKSRSKSKKVARTPATAKVDQSLEKLTSGISITETASDLNPQASIDVAGFPTTASSANSPIQPVISLPPPPLQPPELKSRADSSLHNQTEPASVVSAVEALILNTSENTSHFPPENINVASRTPTEAATSPPIQPAASLPFTPAQPTQLKNATDSLLPSQTEPASVMSTVEALTPNTSEDTSHFPPKNINVGDRTPTEAATSPPIQPAASLPFTPAQPTQLKNATDSLLPSQTEPTSVVSAVEALIPNTSEDTSHFQPENINVGDRTPTEAADINIADRTATVAATSPLIQPAVSLPFTPSQPTQLKNTTDNLLPSQTEPASVMSTVEALTLNTSENTSHFPPENINVGDRTPTEAADINIADRTPTEAITSPPIQPAASLPFTPAQPTQLRNATDSLLPSQTEPASVMSAVEALILNTSEDTSHFPPENINVGDRTPTEAATSPPPIQPAASLPFTPAQPTQLKNTTDSLLPSQTEPASVMSAVEALILNTSEDTSHFPPENINITDRTPTEAADINIADRPATEAATSPPIQPAASLPPAPIQSTRLSSPADSPLHSQTELASVMSVVEAVSPNTSEDTSHFPHENINIADRSATEAATSPLIQPAVSLPSSPAQPTELRNATDSLLPSQTEPAPIVSSVEALIPDTNEDTSYFQTENINIADRTPTVATTSSPIQTAASLPSTPAQPPGLRNAANSPLHNQTEPAPIVSSVEALAPDTNEDTRHFQPENIDIASHTPTEAATNLPIQPAVSLPSTPAQSTGLRSTIDIEQPAIAELPPIVANPEVHSTGTGIEEHNPLPEAAKDTAFDNLPPAQGFAIGGHVTASHNVANQQVAPSDTVPAMLTPGEFVINAKDAQKNLNLLQHINSGGKAANTLLSHPLTNGDDQLDTTLVDSTKVESAKGSSVQRKSSDVSLPRALSSLVPTFLGMETEKQSFSPLSPLQSHQNEKTDSHQSSTHYPSTPLIFRKRNPQTRTPETHTPNQWSSMQDLLTGSTESSQEFAPLSFISGEHQNSQGFTSPETIRISSNYLPLPKGFADGGEVTVPDIYKAAQPVTETVKRPEPSADDSSHDLEVLAREIYHRLRQRLDLERERYGVYSGRLPW